MGQVKRVKLPLEMRPSWAVCGPDKPTLVVVHSYPGGNRSDPPVFGLGFALRLVRNLAIASGGMLEIDSTRFYLSLPLDDRGGRAEQGAR